MVIVLAISAYINIDFWYYETFSYYNNFINYSVGKKSWEEYIDFWDAKRNYDVASYIKPRTDPADQLFVWGTEPAIYTLTDLLPVGRYTVAYHVVDFNAYDQTMIELQTTFPKYIIDVDNAPEFEELKNFLANYYILETNIDGVRIYRKADNNKMLKF